MKIFRFLDSQTPENIDLVAKDVIYWLDFSSTCYMPFLCTEKPIAAFKIKIGEVQQKHAR